MKNEVTLTITQKDAANAGHNVNNGKSCLLFQAVQRQFPDSIVETGWSAFYVDGVHYSSNLPAGFVHRFYENGKRLEKEITFQAWKTDPELYKV